MAVLFAVLGPGYIEFCPHNHPGIFTAIAYARFVNREIETEQVCVPAPFHNGWRIKKAPFDCWLLIDACAVSCDVGPPNKSCQDILFFFSPNRCWNKS
jgi:hypothetical protein